MIADPVLLVTGFATSGLRRLHIARFTVGAIADPVFRIPVDIGSCALRPAFSVFRIVELCADIAEGIVRSAVWWITCELDFLQFVPGKSSITKRGYAFSDVDILQLTVFKCLIPNVNHAVRDRNRNQARTAERTITNVCHTIRNRDRCQRTASGERIPGNRRLCIGNLNGLQRGTSGKRTTSKLSHAVRNADRGHIAAQ